MTDDIKKIIEKQRQDFYGDESFSGSMPNPEDGSINVDSALEQYIGNKPEKTLDIEKEIRKDQEGKGGRRSAVELIEDPDPRLERLGNTPMDFLDDNPNY